MTIDKTKMLLSTAVGVDFKRLETALTAQRIDECKKAISANEIDKKTLEEIQLRLVGEGVNNWPTHRIAQEWGISIPTAQAIIDDLSAGIMSATADLAPVKG
jgi:hypothetical protein